MRGPALNRRESAADGAIPAGAAEFADAMVRALRDRPRSIEPKFFYDAAGMALFERICELDEYYLTRTEIAILQEQAQHIARLIGPHADVVEFGAGSPAKAGIVLTALPSPSRYVPVDLSAAPADGALHDLQSAFPGLRVEPLAADFVLPLALPAPRPGDGRRVGLFLGSTIGNLSAAQARDFLAGTAASFAGGGLLVGVDLVKDPAVLHRAYNDAQGVTAAFNRNVLARANRELGADFDPDSFDHYACYRPDERRIEMHLVSRRRQAVHVCGETFEFAEGESLHTENSHKFTVEGFQQLARAAGLAPGPVWCDRLCRFSVHWLAVPPRPAVR